MPELIEYLEDGCSLEAVPHTYGCVKVRDTFTIPNTYGFDFPTDFGSTSAADTYFHAVDDGGTTYFFPPATTSPSTPTLATNVAGIQAFLTSIGSGITYTVNAFNEIVLTYANPGDETIWSFWMGTSNSSDSWNNKTPPTLHDLRTDSVLYKSVQVVKLKDSEGNYIDRYFSPSTTGPLKEVNLDIFDTFSFGECHECKKEIFATHIKYYLQPANKVWTLFSKLEPIHPDAGSYGSSFIIIGDQIAGTHPGGPYVGNDINGWFVYSMVSPTQPANDSNGHYWIQGQPSSFSTVTFNRINPDIAFSASEICTPIQEIKEKDSCTGEETYRYVIEDGSGTLVPVTDIDPTFTEDRVIDSCDGSLIGKCTYNTIECETPIDVANYYTATNAPVRLDITSLGYGKYHFGIEDAAFNGAFGLFTTNYAISAFTRIFDDVYLPNPGVQLWNTAITNITSVFGGKRIEFDYDSTLVPGNGCDTLISNIGAASNSTLTGVSGGVTAYVALLSQSMVINTVPKEEQYLKVKEVCVEPKEILFEKEVCINVNNGASCYEVIKVYTRNDVTGIQTLLHYETKTGEVITDTVQEICCTCNCLCDYVQNLAPNKFCPGYGSSVPPNTSNSMFINNRYIPGAMFNGECGAGLNPTGFAWELQSLIVDGIEQVPVGTTYIADFLYGALTFDAYGTPNNYAAYFNSLPIIASNGIVLSDNLFDASYNTSKPFLATFKQYPTGNGCTSNGFGGRYEHIWRGNTTGDGFSYVSANPVGPITHANVQTAFLFWYNQLTSVAAGTNYYSETNSTAGISRSIDLRLENGLCQTL
jgi:hypothetical protein